MTILDTLAKRLPHQGSELAELEQAARRHYAKTMGTDLSPAEQLAWIRSLRAGTDSSTLR